jgi:SNF2 family DNA or RNA helicase
MTKSRTSSIITYRQLAYSYPSKNRIAEIRREVRELVDARPELSKKRRDDIVKEEVKQRIQCELGSLHQVDWFRVVLDEGHAIKKHTSRSQFIQGTSGEFRHG